MPSINKGSGTNTATTSTTTTDSNKGKLPQPLPCWNNNDESIICDVSSLSLQFFPVKSRVKICRVGVIIILVLVTAGVSLRSSSTIQNQKRTNMMSVIIKNHDKNTNAANNNNNTTTTTTTTRQITSITSGTMMMINSNIDDNDYHRHQQTNDSTTNQYLSPLQAVVRHYQQQQTERQNEPLPVGNNPPSTSLPETVPSDRNASSSSLLLCPRNPLIPQSRGTAWMHHFDTLQKETQMLLPQLPRSSSTTFMNTATATTTTAAITSQRQEEKKEEEPAISAVPPPEPSRRPAGPWVLFLGDSLTEQWRGTMNLGRRVHIKKYVNVQWSFHTCFAKMNNKNNNKNSTNNDDDDDATTTTTKHDTKEQAYARACPTSWPQRQEQQQRLHGMALGAMGDATFHLLYKLRHGLIPADYQHHQHYQHQWKASKSSSSSFNLLLIHLLIGTNDLGYGCSKEAVIMGILNLVHELRTVTVPGVPVLVHGLLPRSGSYQKDSMNNTNDDDDNDENNTNDDRNTKKDDKRSQLGDYWKDIQWINSELQKMSQQKGTNNSKSPPFYFVDHSALFLKETASTKNKNDSDVIDPNNSSSQNSIIAARQYQLIAERMPDGVHPNVQGNRIWLYEIAKTISNIINILQREEQEEEEQQKQIHNTTMTVRPAQIQVYLYM